MSLLKRLILSLPAVLIAVTIFILSHGPQPGLPELGIEWEDKLMHIIAYLIFGISIILFLVANFREPGFKKIALITLIFGSVYGFSDELHQYYVPGRYAEILDWVADFIGILISILLARHLINKLIKTSAS